MDISYRRVGTIQGSWLFMVFGKIIFFISLPVLLFLFSQLQSYELIDDTITYGFVVVLSINLFLFLSYDFLPKKKCPICEKFMSKSYRETESTKQKPELVRCCKGCKVYMGTDIIVD